MSASAEEALSPEAQQILDRAKSLPRDEQLQVAQQLHDAQTFTRAEGLHPEWDAELDGRLQEIKGGTAVLHDWQDVKQELLDIADS